MKKTGPEYQTSDLLDYINNIDFFYDIFLFVFINWTWIAFVWDNSTVYQKHLIPCSFNLTLLIQILPAV